MVILSFIEHTCIIFKPVWINCCHHGLLTRNIMGAFIICPTTKLCGRLSLTRIIMVTWLKQAIIVIFVWVDVFSERIQDLLVAPHIFTRYLSLFLLWRYLRNY